MAQWEQKDNSRPYLPHLRTGGAEKKAANVVAHPTVTE